MVWERTRHVLRLRSALREFFPAALAAYGDLDEPDTLQLLLIAPDPDSAARLSTAKISAVLARAAVVAGNCLLDGSAHRAVCRLVGTRRCGGAL
jgi:hypothetical protein